LLLQDVEVVSMSNKKRVAERDHTLMISPSDMGGAFAVSANALFVGPGDPGKGDDWQFPPKPTDSKTVPATGARPPAEDEPSREDLQGK
jgi:hypothetical protein